ncbi:MAG: hypothetical protein HY816_22125 [Candidatus Wallbacteria bacterium]|nr:hypothetical protein [Candidatus Wallbacteria bacterium]
MAAERQGGRTAASRAAGASEEPVEPVAARVGLAAAEETREASQAGGPVALPVESKEDSRAVAPGRPGVKAGMVAWAAMGAAAVRAVWPGGRREERPAGRAARAAVGRLRPRT